MNNISSLAIFFVLFTSFSLTAYEKGDVNCEPSLIFPDVSILESLSCFSYEMADNLYSEDDKALKKYLDMFHSSQHQIIYRYFYYLRKNEPFSALMTYMLLTAKGVKITSIDVPSNEFNNIVLKGIKKSSNSRKNKLFPLSNNREPVKINELSNNFFSALSYIASYIVENKGSKNVDNEILERSFSYVISNIQTGVDWDGDYYLNGLFNSFITMKNKGLLKSFIVMFYFYLNRENKIPSFSDYLKLRELGMVKDMRPGFEKSPVVSKEQKIIAAFFLDNINNFNNFIFTKDINEIKHQDNSEICAYLDERTVWLESLKDFSLKDISFNEGVKIAEQCPTSFFLPFKINNGAVIVYDKAKWIIDLAFAIDYIIKENILGEDSTLIIEAALKSSLQKNRYYKDKNLTEDILSFVLETGTADRFIKSVFAKQMNWSSDTFEVDPITQSAEILSEILF